MKAGQLREIIEEISKREKLSLLDIAAKINSNRSYLSKIINGDAQKDMTDILIRKFTKSFPGYFEMHHKSNTNVSHEITENNTPEAPDPLDPSRLLKILENISTGHKEACEALNKMADNEKMTLLKIPTTDVPEGIVLADPSILLPLAKVLSDISMGRLKFHTTEEALKELGIVLGQHKPYKSSSKSTQTDAGRSGTDGA